MINQDKWINTLPRTNNSVQELDHQRWERTIPKKRSSTSVKKYSLMLVFFVFGLLFVSAVKNKTRNLQKEINNLEASIGVIKYNLDQAILDNEVITSPENIALLAKEYLHKDLSSYKRSQVRHINEKNGNLNKTEKTNKKNLEKFQVKIKKQVTEKIEQKKAEIKKLQDLYNSPESIPDEIKVGLAKQIHEKRKELKDIYKSPSQTITFEKIQKWGVVQIVKAFLGIPVIPGR